MFFPSVFTFVHTHKIVSLLLFYKYKNAQNMNKHIEGAPFFSPKFLLHDIHNTQGSAMIYPVYNFIRTSQFHLLYTLKRIQIRPIRYIRIIRLAVDTTHQQDITALSDRLSNLFLFLLCYIFMNLVLIL